MKIKIISHGEPIRVHHDPRDVFYNKKENTIEIRNPKTNKIDDKFFVIKRTLDWKSCTDDSNYEEIHAIFYVQQMVTN